MIWFFLVLAGVSVVYGDVQVLDDALENSIFSSINCGQRHLWLYYLGSLFISSKVISGYFKVHDVCYIRLLFISLILGCWLWIFQPCDHPPYLLSTHPMKDASAVVPFYEFCLDRHRLWSIVWTATWVCNCSQISVFVCCVFLWVHVQLHSFGKKISLFKYELVQWPFWRRHSSYLLLNELIFRLTHKYMIKRQQIFWPCAWALKTGRSHCAKPHYLAATGSTVCSLSTL